MPDVTITGLPNATLPLDGSERVGMDQAGATKDATTADIAATLPNATTTVAGKMSAGDKSKLNSIASSATANASDAELRDRATHTGEQAISTVTGLQTALNGKATSAQGALAESAIQPGNPALSDSREWSATTITQAEAEAGTTTTRRAFTAQRVQQAITAWWTGASMAAGRAIVEAANAAAQRTLLGLGVEDSPVFTGLEITGTGPVVIPHIHGSIAGNFYVHVRNTSGGTLPAGTAVYVVGNIGDTDRRQVAACDPTDPLKMPAIAVLETALANNGDGDAINIGELRPFNTSGLTQSALLYVGAGGALTATEPTSGIVQSVATVARVNAQTGVLSIQIGDKLGTAALRNVGATAGTVAAGDDARFAALAASMLAFRDANRVYVSPRGNDANNGTAENEPLRTLGAAALAAQSGDLVVVGPGVYTETVLPIRWRRNVGLLCSGLRNTTVKPAAGQEMAGFFRVDSGFWCWGLEFAGHQANSATGDLSWAISFNELADNTSIGAVGLGAYILKSPYIQNCSSITAEDDAGQAGSISTGDTGGGIKVDGNACAVNSPIRSMVVDSYTQVNLGGPGCLVLNDGYAQLVSFFGTFCEYHVKTISGGQVNLSGGGTSDFGIYGLMADGYSPRPVFTGASRIANFGAARIDKAVTIDAATNTFSSASHGLIANDQVVFSASEGTLPTPLVVGTTYFVRGADLAAGAFSVSTTSGGAILDIAGATTGTYSVIRQGVTEIDVTGFSANRLGRQIKYPTAGSRGSAGYPEAITARSGSTAGSSFTVTLGSISGIGHEYVGGGTLTVGGTSYNVTVASYNSTTGVTTITATGYAPVVGASITLSGLSFICDSSSRPSAGQLMFPQLVFPRDASTGSVDPKNFTYTKTGANTLTFSEAPASTGPDHEYVSGGTVVIGGTNYGVTAATYNKASGLVTITTVTTLPGAISSTGTVTVGGLVFICPTSAYVVTSSVPIDASGNTVANDSVSRAGYRVLFFSGTNGGLRNTLAVGQVLDFRQRSQISAPGHTFEFVGSGTNYSALPWNGGVPIPANKIVETNNGKVYSSNTDELGNFAIGTQFSVDGTTGSVTINTDQFNLSGLNFIGPFSRNGGISTVGEQLREISNNTSLLASTGTPDGNTAPTQFAVKTYADNKFLQGLTVTASQPISVSDTSTVDGQGFQTRNRNIALSLNVANGLARLDGSGLVPAALLPSYVDDVLELANLAAFPVTGETGKIYVALDSGKIYRWSGSTYIEISPSPGSTDSVSEGSVNLYFTEARVRNTVLTGFTPGAGTVSATDSVLVALQKLAANIAGAGTGSVTSVGLSLPSLFTVTGTPVTTSGTLTATLAAQAAGVVLAGPASGAAAAPTFRALTAGDVNLGTTSTPQFAALGLGVAPASGFELTLGGSTCQLVSTVTVSSGVYTLDVTAANEFVTAAAIAGATTINLSSLASLPAGYRWRGVLSFSYTSGTVSWFTGNTGYTVKWDGGIAPTLTASQLETVVITVTGGSTIIEVTAQQGRA